MTTSTLQKPLNSTIKAVIIGLSQEQFDKLKSNYDVFTRADVSDECILDLGDFSDDDISEISETIRADLSDLESKLVVVHVVQH